MLDVAVAISYSGHTPAAWPSAWRRCDSAPTSHVPARLCQNQKQKIDSLSRLVMPSYTSWTARPIPSAGHCAQSDGAPFIDLKLPGCTIALLRRPAVLPRAAYGSMRPQDSTKLAGRHRHARTQHWSESARYTAPGAGQRPGLTMILPLSLIFISPKAAACFSSVGSAATVMSAPDFRWVCTKSW